MSAYCALFAVFRQDDTPGGMRLVLSELPRLVRAFARDARAGAVGREHGAMASDLAAMAMKSLAYVSHVPAFAAAFTGQMVRGALDVVLASLALASRPSIESSFVTFLSCTDNASEVAYLKELDSAAQNVDEVDDYRTEYAEVTKAGRQLYQHFSVGDWALRAVSLPLPFLLVSPSPLPLFISSTFCGAEGLPTQQQAKQGPSLFLCVCVIFIWTACLPTARVS